MSTLRHLAKYLLRPQYRQAYQAEQALKKEAAALLQKPRYSPGHSKVLGSKLFYTDAASTSFMLRELFLKQIYAFRCKKESPFIIDGGANIGMSLIYFKQLFPQAHILAFEPDAKIFACLEKNVQSFGLQGVELLQKGLWSEETTLQFHSEGADGGRIDSQAGQRIDTTRLSNFLQKPVDFLKLDIEGAELEVLKEAEEQLPLVQQLFVEYHSFIGQEQTLDELLAILRRQGFRVYVQSPALNAEQPFLEQEQYAGMDMQLNVFALRK